MNGKFAAATALAATALLCAASAQAADAPNTDSVQVEVTAQIAQRCGLAPSGATSLNGDKLDEAFSGSIAFALDCNVPFKLGVSSTKGAMKLAAGSKPDGDQFTDTKVYGVALSVTTDGGPMTGERCESSALASATGGCAFYGAAAGTGMSSSNRTAIRRTGTLSIDWAADAADGPRRPAGAYSDTLTIVIGASS